MYGGYVVELKTMIDNQFDMKRLKCTNNNLEGREIELRGFRTKSENEIQGFHKDEF